MENIQSEQKTSPKDVFLHLLAIIMLYVSAAEFLVLVFQYINLTFPDVLEMGNYYYGGENPAYGYIRWAVSTLIVVFPTYIITSRFLNKAYDAEPGKRNLRIRKWLIYFTLFVAALAIIGDLVTLVYTFLNGEFTMRFVLKVLAVFFVAGSIFYYYLSDLRQHKTE